MRRWVGAGALIAATLAPVTPAAAAGAGVDTTPPAIGSCFDMTKQEVTSASNANPAVPCTSAHTTMTFDVVEFPEPPDWNDEDSYAGDVYDRCNRSWLAVLGGDAKKIGRSSYTYYWLLPTPDQRAAGASWVRCELALHGGDEIAELPRAVRLGRLPLPDRVSWCLEGERTDFQRTVCSRAHQYRATVSIRLRGDHWPGLDRAKTISLRYCRERMHGDSWRYSWPASRYWWKLGYRYAICLPKTRS